MSGLLRTGWTLCKAKGRGRNLQSREELTSLRCPWKGALGE